jgi:hypothetical protein
MFQFPTAPAFAPGNGPLPGTLSVQCSLVTQLHMLINVQVYLISQSLKSLIASCSSLSK